MFLPLAAALLLTAPAASALTPKDDADRAERAADPRDRMICKRFIETGSLVKGYKVCKTKAEWDAARDAARRPSVTSGSCNSANTGLCEPR